MWLRSKMSKYRDEDEEFDSDEERKGNSKEEKYSESKEQKISGDELIERG